MKMSPRSSGYMNPDAALWEHVNAGVPLWPKMTEKIVKLQYDDFYWDNKKS